MDPITDSARAIAAAVNARQASAAEIAEALIPHVARVDAQPGRLPELTPELMREHAAPRRRARRAPASGCRWPACRSRSRTTCA